MNISCLFSFRKIKYPSISWFSIWDERTNFSPKVQIRALVRLKSVSIGDYSRIGLNTAISHAEIGRFTAIGKNCSINIGRHPTNYVTAHSMFYGNSWKFHKEWIKPICFEEFPPVKIGNDVWIGINCIIMGGVTIGDGAIVAAGSIITRDVPPYAIVGGVPAKVIKYRFPEEMIARLEQIAWWNLSDDEITRKLAFFHKENPTMEDLDEFFPE